MSLEGKEKELSFHFDRIRESTLQYLQSILGNPSLSPDEQVVLLCALADRHTAIAELIKSKLDLAFLSAREQA